MKIEMKLNSEDLLVLVTPEINAVWKRRYFFLILPKYNSMQIQ